MIIFCFVVSAIEQGTPLLAIALVGLDAAGFNHALQYLLLSQMNDIRNQVRWCILLLFFLKGYVVIKKQQH